MPDVTLWHTDFTPEQIGDGDINAEPYSEVIEVNGAEQAADILLNHGLVEINSPDSYYDPDGSVLLSSHTGERRQTSGHLHGFAPKHERRVADIVRRRSRGER